METALDAFVAHYIKQRGFGKSFSTFSEEANITDADQGGHHDLKVVHEHFLKWEQKLKKAAELKEAEVNANGVSNGAKDAEPSGKKSKKKSKKKKQLKNEDKKDETAEGTKVEEPSVEAEAAVVEPKPKRKKSKKTAETAEDSKKTEEVKTVVQEPVEVEAEAKAEAEEEPSSKKKKRNRRSKGNVEEGAVEMEVDTKPIVQEKKAAPVEDKPAPPAAEEKPAAGQESSKKKKKRAKLEATEVAKAEAPKAEPSEPAMEAASQQQEEIEGSKKKHKKNAEKAENAEAKEPEPAVNSPDAVEKSGQKRKRTNKGNAEDEKTAGTPFQRVRPEEVEFHDPRLQDNSYWAKDGAENGWGAKAQQVLGQVRGKGFRHEKTKKKRGSYMGGILDVQSHSIKFDSD